MTWLDVDGIRQYIGQHPGNATPSRKFVYRMVESGLRVSRAKESPDRKRGGSRIFSCPEWIDAFLLARAEPTPSIHPHHDERVRHLAGAA